MRNFTLGCGAGGGVGRVVGRKGGGGEEKHRQRTGNPESHGVGRS